MRITIEATQADHERDYIEDPSTVLYTTSVATPRDELDSIAALELAIAALVAWGYPESNFDDVLKLLRKA